MSAEWKAPRRNNSIVGSDGCDRCCCGCGSFEGTHCGCGWAWRGIETTEKKVALPFDRWIRRQWSMLLWMRKLWGDPLWMWLGVEKDRNDGVEGGAAMFSKSDNDDVIGAGVVGLVVVVPTWTTVVDGMKTNDSLGGQALGSSFFCFFFLLFKLFYKINAD